MKSALEIKELLLNGEVVKQNKWAAVITDNDEVEVWDEVSGDGFATTLAHLDTAVIDFMKAAKGLFPDKMPAPKKEDKAPSLKSVLGPDSSSDEPWSNPKVNKNPPVGGKGSETDLGKDSTGEGIGPTPAVVKNPPVGLGRGGLPDKELGPDSTGNVPSWGKQQPKIADTFSMEVENTAPSYSELVNASPSADLLAGITDPEKWAYNMAAKSLFMQEPVIVDGKGNKEAEDEPDEDSEEHGKKSNSKVATEAWVVTSDSPMGKLFLSLDNSWITDFENAQLFEKEQEATAKAEEVGGEVTDMDEFSLGIFAGTKIKETWDDYGRDIEAEDAESLYHLIKSLNQDDPYDWAVSRPQTHKETPDQIGPVDKVAVDSEAKDYWEKYYEGMDYGKEMVKDDMGELDREDDVRGEPEKKKAQAMPSAPGGAAPAPKAPMPAPLPTSNPKPPGAPGAPGGAPTPPTKPAPGAGDEGLKALGWTFEDIKLMSPEDKQKILKVELKKPGTGSGSPESKPAPKAPMAPSAPKTDPTGMPSDPLSGPAPVPADLPKPVASRKAREGSDQKKIVSAFSRLIGQAGPPISSDTTDPSPPAPPSGLGGPLMPGAKQDDPLTANPGASSGLGKQDSSSIILETYNTMLNQPVNANSAKQIASLKAEAFLETLAKDHGISSEEIRQVFGLDNDQGIVSLFR
jgi:hypothetical protein